MGNDKNATRYASAEQTRKCKQCGEETTGTADVCWKCLENPKRQKAFKVYRREPLVYWSCEYDGAVLQILELDGEGKPTKFYCPVCREEITEEESQVREYDPELYDYRYFCDDPEKESGFKPARLAESIKANFLFVCDRKTNILYRFDDIAGIWRADGEVYLKELVAKSLKANNYEHHFRNVLFHLKSITLQDVQFNSQWIATPTCLLNPKTAITMAFTPNEFTLQRIPVEFKPEAECPANLKFLGEVLEPDQIPIVQEAIGYCLLRAMPIHTGVVLLGEGANGKSTLLNIINAFLGAENVSHATLQQLCEGKFELAQLHNKLANICDDLPSDSLKSVSNFKNLTGNAPIQAQHKFKDPFDFLSYAKPFFACNKLPPASEDTLAYYRRFIILNFNRIFTGKKADKNLLEKLTVPNELSGLLNFALKGLKRLLQSEQFSNARSIEETRRQYIRTADSCQSFLEEATETTQDQSDCIIDDELYQRYIDFCVLHKLPKKQKRDLTISIQKNRPEAQRTQIRILKERKRVWQYLKIKESVTTVTTVTGVSILRKNGELPNTDNREKAGTAVTPVTAGASIDSDNVSKTCGQCRLWHTCACVISGDPSCITPAAKYALNCRGFKGFNHEKPAAEVS